MLSSRPLFVPPIGPILHAAAGHPRARITFNPFDRANLGETEPLQRATRAPINGKADRLPASVPARP